ncbi:putative mitochondrial protein [Cucumis melo var. makuwa]|uniref:Mitochondrial protein n=1 Tax=Cucumis melo var. makuwa TaxID=1194695 RepID=A0A5A7TPN5_CUCMM|nr:putative mitochondrial protein [Cucumis melo var. makuwa]TYJ96233.1 putative mitochondrial protein [Cucumis melo var. makuwa]
MEKGDIARPISTILDGSNYITWANQMRSFLIGRKLWRIVTGDITKPIKPTPPVKNTSKNNTEHNDANTSDETTAEDTKYIERLEDWDSKNHQIITWLELWDFLYPRFQSIGLAHYYQLHSTLVNLNQEVGQSVNKYLATLQPIWTQLDQAKISPDHIRLIKVLMGLRPEYESVRAALLHRNHLPSLDAAVQEILFEKKRLGLVSSLPFDVALATTHLRLANETSFCKNCKLHDHKFANCPTIECRYCHKRGHILDNCPTRPPRPPGHSHKPKFSPKVGSSSVVAAATSSDITAPSSLQLTDLHDLLKQVQDSQTGQVIGTGRKVGRLFELTSLQQNHVFPAISAPVTDNTIFQWHLRLGHASSDKLRNLASSGLLNNVSNPHSFFTDPFTNLFPTTDSPQPTSELTQSPITSALSDLSSVPYEEPEHAPVRRSTRVRETPSHLKEYHCFSIIMSLDEPSSYKEASTNPLWQQAMNDELQALEKTHTWDYVDLPPGKKPIGCKWIFKVKTHSDGSIERYKARLVAKGYSQEYDIDYEVTFAPVARMTSVRSLLAIAATKQWPLLQMDVKNAFLNGTLSEEVYMKPPPDTTPPPQKVCLLRRALYGLKQAPRAWFATFSSTITQLGFTSSPHDSALFTRQTSNGIVLLLLYVDDMIIAGEDPQTIFDLQCYLDKHFEMKDLGNLNYFLGLEISSSPSGYYLSQANYASDLLSQSGITDSATFSTPLDPNGRLTPFDGVPLDDPTLYRQLVGNLIYLTVTRPDIAYAVHIVSQFMVAPRTIHFTVVLRILRYIKGTLGHGLQFSSQSSLVLSGFSNADWTGDPTDRRSTTGYCFYLGDALISWRSKKQSVVSRSSTESEYCALADATSELLWLRWLLTDMGAPQTSPTILHCDNRSAIQIAHNNVFHE